MVTTFYNCLFLKKEEEMHLRVAPSHFHIKAYYCCLCALHAQWERMGQFTPFSTVKGEREHHWKVRRPERQMSSEAALLSLCNTCYIIWRQRQQQQLKRPAAAQQSKSCVTLTKLSAFSQVFRYCLYKRWLPITDRQTFFVVALNVVCKVSLSIGVEIEGDESSPLRPFLCLFTVLVG